MSLSKISIQAVTGLASPPSADSATPKDYVDGVDASSPLRSGSGVPNTAAPLGAVFRRTDVGAGARFFVKEGSNDADWAPLLSLGPGGSGLAAANQIFAGPTSGPNAAPTFRSAVAQDLNIPNYLNVPGRSNLNSGGTTTVDWENRALAGGSWTCQGLSAVSASAPVEGINIRRGMGNPNGAITGTAGDIWQRTDGTPGNVLYVCTSGTNWQTTGSPSFSPQNANLIFAGPTSGGAMIPTFRSLDKPDLIIAGLINGTSNTLFDASSVSSVAFGTRVMSDSSGQQSVDWENRTLKNSGGTSTIEWQGLRLKYLGNTVLDWGAQVLNGGNGSSISWTDDIMYDAGAVKSIDWQNRELYNQAGDAVVNYADGLLDDASGNVSVDWDDRKLRSTGVDTESVDWENRRLRINGFSSVAWSQGRLNNPSDGSLSVDWSANLLNSAVDGTTLDWLNKRLDGLASEWTARGQYGSFGIIPHAAYTASNSLGTSIPTNSATAFTLGGATGQAYLLIAYPTSNTSNLGKATTGIAFREGASWLYTPAITPIGEFSASLSVAAGGAVSIVNNGTSNPCTFRSVAQRMF